MVLELIGLLLASFNLTLCLLKIYSRWMPFIAVCTDCGHNYTDDEMKVAIIILSLILCVLLCILLCQCYSRMRHGFRKQMSNSSNEVIEGIGKRMLPAASYSKKEPQWRSLITVFMIKKAFKFWKFIAFFR